jgi:carbon-monoxide dehydrogenase small subunit
MEQTPHPTADEVRHAIAGNLCRCTGYEPIVEAVLAAAAGEGSPP